MKQDIFHDRERAEEAAYFHKQDAILIERLRQKAMLADVAHALAAKLQVDEPELLEQIKKLGVTLDTGAAFILAPLVEVAWADGHVSHAERRAVLHEAAHRGVEPGSADYLQLLEWLAQRPSEAILQAALQAIRVGLSVLPRGDAEQRIAGMIKACESVAQSAGGLVAVLEPRGISYSERSVIAAIRAQLESTGGEGNENNDNVRSGG